MLDNYSFFAFTFFGPFCYSHWFSSAISLFDIDGLRKTLHDLAMCWVSGISCEGFGLCEAL